MEIIQYTEDHQQFRQNLRSFLEKEVIPNVDQWEKDKIVPKDVWKKMGQAGFLCPMVSKEYGGIGGDFLYSVIGIEEMAKTNHSGLMSQLHSDIVVPYMTSYGSEEIKKKYLPGCISGDIISAVAMTEPGAGSDLAAMTTTAVEEGDEVVINGSKTFISNGINCDLVIVAAKDPAVENVYQALSLYVIEDGTPGFKKGSKFDKMGFHSQDTAELFFTNCRIPVKNRLSDKGTGFIMLMEKLQQERLVCAIGAVAAAELMINWTVEYCKKTPASATGKPIIKNQANQFAIVEMLTEIKIGRTFVDKLVMDHVEKKNVVIETSMAKYWTTELAKRVADQCIDVTGNFAMLEDCPLSRGFRDVRVMSIFAGTNEIMKGIVGKFMGM